MALLRPVAAIRATTLESVSSRKASEKWAELAAKSGLSAPASAPWRTARKVAATAGPKPPPRKKSIW